MVLAFIAISTSLIVIANFLRMPWLNPITALVFPWGTVMVLASLPGALNPGLSSALWTMVMVGFVAIAAGSLTGWIIVGKTPASRKSQEEVQTTRVGFFHKILTVVLAGYAVVQGVDAWPVLQRLGGIQAIFSSSSALGNEYKYQYSQDRLATTSSALDSASFVTGTLGYILFLGHLSLFTGAILWRSGRRLLASIPLILAAGYSLFSLQRTSFFMCFLIFVVTYIYSRRLDIGVVQKRASSRTTGKLAALVFAGVVLIPVLLYPIQQRNNTSHNSTGLESLAQYLLSSVAGLNARINSDLAIAAPPAQLSGEVAPTEGLGAYTFTGLFALMKRLGLPVPVAPHSLDYYSVEIFGAPFTTNTGTSFLDFYLDYGWTGVVMMSFILGLIAALSLRLFLGGTISALPISVMLIVSIFWSFFVNALMGDFRYSYMTFLASFLIRWILYGHRNHQVSFQSKAVSARLFTKGV